MLLRDRISRSNPGAHKARRQSDYEKRQGNGCQTESHVALISFAYVLNQTFLFLQPSLALLCLPEPQALSRLDFD